MLYRIFFILIFMFAIYNCSDSPTEQKKNDDIVEDQIDENGGEISNDMIKLTFEPGTFGSSETVKIQKETEVPVAPDESIALYDKNNIYKITTTADSLLQPVKITISYDPEFVGSDFDPFDLIILHFSDVGWKYEYGFVDKNNKNIIFETDKFSWFSVGKPQHKVEYPTVNTPLNNLITFDNVEVPSNMIQSYDYSYSFNGFMHHIEYYWGKVQAPASIDPDGIKNQVVYAARFRNDEENTSFVFDEEIQSCLVFKLDLSRADKPSLEFDYNCNSEDYGYFYIELQQGRFFWGQSDNSWYTLRDDQYDHKYRWGNGEWVHLKFQFPQYIPDLFGLEYPVYGSELSEKIFVRLRFHTIKSNKDSDKYGPFVDNIIFNADLPKPTVTINKPSNNQSFLVDTDVLFEGESISSEGNTISGSSLVWLSDKDGQIGTGNSFTKDNLSVGYHKITLQATDAYEVINTDEITIQITSPANTAPTAKFTINPSSGNTSTVFQFDASSSSDNEDATSALQVRWDFDYDNNFDTDYSTSKTITHQYSSTGTYHIRMEVKDTGGLTSYQFKQVDVSNGNTAPTASFIVSPSSGTTSTTFNFDASSSNDNEDATSALQVRWDWENDGTWDTGFSTTKTANQQYSTTGTKTIKLEVKDTGDLTNSITKQVSVSNGGGATGTVTDIDGNIYQTVKIGEQWWMAENLKVTRYRNGEGIQHVTDYSEWAGLSAGAYCAYNNDDGNIETYGLLYNWYAVDDSRNIAPEGWHVPTDEEWKELEMYLGMSQSDADGTGYRGTDEGSKLKATSGWNNNGNGTNVSGFTALPGGYRRCYDGAFYGVCGYGYWWSATEGSSSGAWSRDLSCSYSVVSRGSGNKQYGFSLRCVRD